jgi:D-proline reductase (dithiol) PrdB
MPRLDRLPDAQRKTLSSFPAQQNATAPFARPAVPLSRSRVALVTTAGLHRRGDRPFGPGDQSYRVIPSDTPTRDIVQSQTSIGFDRSPLMRDINISFPVDRLRELAARGEIGGLATNHYSFIGALRDVRRVEAETGPDVARRLVADGAHVALITPT